MKSSISKLPKQSRVKYDERMDAECIPICDALNRLPGIATIESCCGHEKTPFRIYFRAETVEALPPVAYYLSPCHSFPGWHLRVFTDCSMAPVTFVIEGPTGPKAYEQANGIAGLINEYASDHDG